MVTDGEYYYNWGAERGLSRSKRTDANYAESGNLYNRDARQYKGVTMQMYGEHLLLRSETFPDQPFVLMDRETGNLIDP